VYVPSNDDGSVTVIDQATFAVVDHYRVGKLVQHVVAGVEPQHAVRHRERDPTNSFRSIRPPEKRGGAAIRVDAPYNLYFTPDGSKAVVMAERKNRIDYYDRQTWKRLQSGIGRRAGA